MKYCPPTLPPLSTTTQLKIIMKGRAGAEAAAVLGVQQAAGAVGHLSPRE